MSREFKSHAPASSTKSNETLAKEPASPLTGSRATTTTKDQNLAKNEATGEVGGPTVETDPTKFGDWSVNGRCVDF